MDGENKGKPLLKWMIWGYPYFWKHPSVLDVRPIYETNILPKSSPPEPLQSQKEKLSSSVPIIFQGRAVQLRGKNPPKIKSWKIKLSFRNGPFFGGMEKFSKGGRLANCHYN